MTVEEVGRQVRAPVDLIMSSSSASALQQMARQLAVLIDPELSVNGPVLQDHMGYEMFLTLSAELPSRSTNAIDNVDCQLQE